MTSVKCCIYILYFPIYVYCFRNFAIVAYEYYCLSSDIDMINLKDIIHMLTTLKGTFLQSLALKKDPKYKELCTLLKYASPVIIS